MYHYHHARSIEHERPAPHEPVAVSLLIALLLPALLALLAAPLAASTAAISAVALARVV